MMKTAKVRILREECASKMVWIIIILINGNIENYCAVTMKHVVNTTVIAQRQMSRVLLDVSNWYEITQ